MTAPRRRKGLEAIRDAADAVEPAPTIHVLMLNGIPRGGLTTKEVAAHFGLPYKRILAEIHAGRIRVITGGRDYVVPVSELATIASWADYQGPRT